VKIIAEKDIEALGITPAQCLEWVEHGFRTKSDADLPAKISVHPFQDSFYTAMPCYHPDTGRVAVKVISRVPGSIPALKSQILLYDARTGELLALMDSNWLTAMRTGATAALATKTFAADFNAISISMVGLGTIAHATMQCLLAAHPQPFDVWLLKYKDQAERFATEFADSQATFHIVNDKHELVKNSSALISCVTVMHDQFLPPSEYPHGYTCVPVHVCGFQDCDTEFDHIFGDDTGHIAGFRNFPRFKTFAEISDVLLGKAPGRQSANDRILCYNYGIGLHDLWFASKAYDMI